MNGTHAELATFGWLDWHRASDLLGDAEAAWLGTSGIIRTTRTAGWPAQLPLTTRIHAWPFHGPGPLWRLVPSPDRGTALVTALGDAGTSWPDEPTRRRGVDVSSAADGDWERRWVLGPTSVMFLRSRTTSGSQR